VRGTIERHFTHVGLDCAVVRHDLGAWGSHRCGYVRIPEDHPWHGLSYNDEVPNPIFGRIDERPVEDVGIVNAWYAAVTGVREYERLMEGQVAVHGGLTYAGEGLPGSDGGGWWIGFDCAHLGDTPDVWTEERVAEETARLAEQVAAMAVAP